ncbi:MAG: tRNA (adenosine(37)-N6)-threonylcarbamoyltransferase complex ATPase subunit type 1 TsaE [Deltaproteobacteria bacterium]|nr:MAG: tRNA (adenosine(37)-N6)-threonylcarbamoyltransferase complex ATPase subunit type 1 TsaE [Deltaproteobacteria bacterium]
MNGLILRSGSEEETINCGRTIGNLLDRGDVIALIGELGAGKTYLTKGVALGLGAKDIKEITSPTFTIINEYSGRLPIFHLDFFRLNEEFEVEDLGYEEFFYGPGVSIIEWAEKFPQILPKEYLEVKISILGESKRELEFKVWGDHYREMIEKFQIEGSRRVRRD